MRLIRLPLAVPLLFTLSSQLLAAQPLNRPHLLVSDALEDTIHRVDAATGTYIDRLIDDTADLGGSAHMEIGPNGDLFVGSFSTSEIYRFDLHTGEYHGVFVSGNGLSGIRGFAFAPNGNLIVASASNDQVKEFDGQSGEFVGNLVSNIGTPIAPQFGPTGELYIARGHFQISPDESIEVFDENGMAIRSIGANFVSTPQDLAFGPNGDIYVSNQLEQSLAIVRLDPIDGQLVRVIDSSLSNPQGLEFLPDGTLLAATFSSSVRRYNVETGTFLGDFMSNPQIRRSSDLLYVVPEPPSLLLAMCGLFLAVFAGGAVRPRAGQCRIVTARRNPSFR